MVLNEEPCASLNKQKMNNDLRKKREKRMFLNGFKRIGKSSQDINHFLTNIHCECEKNIKQFSVQCYQFAQSFRFHEKLIFSKYMYILHSQLYNFAEKADFDSKLCERKDVPKFFEIGNTGVLNCLYFEQREFLRIKTQK